ncbi:MAG: hypothetical protein JWP32_1220 [Schumannella sp.]|nr:hypothetical protein [Schumannella sp.]
MCVMADAALEAALKFTDEDLVANRAGRLGPTQQGRMTTMKGRSQVVNLAFGAVFLVVIVAIAAYVLPNYLTGAAASAAPIIVVVVIVVIGLMAFTFFRSRRKLGRMDGAVLMTEGEASGRMGMAPVADSAVLPVYRLSVGKVTFALSTPEPLQAFTNGKRYRAYYVQGTLPILVSAEPA